MKPRFQPDADTGAPLTAGLFDPESYDASEQEFAASLEAKPLPRFVVETVNQDEPVVIDPPTDTNYAQADTAPENVATEANTIAEPSGDSWRDEVAARISHYRARRQPRTPRYPSLQLKFESNESSWNSHSGAAPSAAIPAPSRTAVAMQDALPEMASPLSTVQPPTVGSSDSSAKILVFPRMFAPPVALDELAGPVFDRPRILEVPEMLPPPPALGGMLIEPEEEGVPERRPGFELPLQAAAMSRRMLASAMDAFLALLAFVLFAGTFFRMTGSIPPLRQAVGTSAALLASFWAAYQYLLLVYTGATPGLKLAGLRLCRFDGGAVPRRLRQWRVMASVLSGLSLALGYAWCFLDEDELCWHDRITHTYMAPKAEKAAAASIPH